MTAQTKIKEIMTILDKNTENIKESDYLCMAKLLMELHKMAEKSSTPTVPFSPVLHHPVPPQPIPAVMIGRIHSLGKQVWTRLSPSRKMMILKELVSGTTIVNDDNASLKAMEERLIQYIIDTTMDDFDHNLYLKQIYKLGMKTHNNHIYREIISLCMEYGIECPSWVAVIE